MSAGHWMAQEEGLIWLQGAFWISPEGEISGDSAWLGYRRSIQSDSLRIDSAVVNRSLNTSNRSETKLKELRALKSNQLKSKSMLTAMLWFIGVFLLGYIGLKVLIKYV